MNNLTNKRFYSVTARNLDTNQLTRTNYYNTKPKSVETIRNNNKLLKSFVKGGGFGFNYYLNDNSEKDTQDNSNKINNSNFNNSNHTQGSSNTGGLNVKNVVVFKDDSFAKENPKEEDINTEIDKLLNYYMSQLNEKIDKSYDELDDEDDNDDETLNEEEINNMMKPLNLEDKDKSLKKLPSIVSKLEQENLSGIKQTRSINNSKISNISENSKTERNGNMSAKQSSVNESEKQDKVNKPLSRIVSTKSREKSAKSQNLEKSLLNKSNLSNVSNKANAPSENILNKTNGSLTRNPENPNSKLEIDDQKTISPIKQMKEENLNDISCRSIGSIKSPTKIEKPEQTPQKVTNIAASEQEQPIQGLSLQPITYRYTNPKSKKSNKDEEFPEIRVVRSFEDKDMRQNIEQFDIEYMCRCLGLALMKHIESAKDKFHILDLINTQEKFDFFNSVFNMNFDFFNSFLNLQNKISNLDKLDAYYKLNENCTAFNSKEMQFMKESELKKEPLVSLYSHINYGNEINNETINVSKESKSSMESNVKVDSMKINSNNTNNNNPNKYKNVGDKVKNILTQDLTAINEVDSMEFVQNNLLFTVDQKIKKQPSQYIDLLQQSATNFLMEKEEKLINENNQKIDEQNEEEYGDDFNEEIDEENESRKKKSESKIGETCNKFSTLKNNEQITSIDNNSEENKEFINEEITETLPQKEEVFESGMIESNYIIDIKDAEKLTTFLLKSCEIYDDDYVYIHNKIIHKRYIPPPDPTSIYEFCANIMIMTKMEKEVIMISLIYLERFIFNTGVLLNSRNWKRLLFTALAIASKIWDDDSFENNHFAQVFTHLKIGEINLLERTFLELINYKVYVKCSEYFKYFFIIKSIALKYNFNGFNIVPISVEKMMKLQESAFQKQKKLKRHYSNNHSTVF